MENLSKSTWRPWSPNRPQSRVGTRIKDVQPDAPLAVLQSPEPAFLHPDVPEVLDRMDHMMRGTFEAATLSRAFELLNIGSEEQLEQGQAHFPSGLRSLSVSDILAETEGRRRAWLCLPQGWLELSREWQLHLGAMPLPEGTLVARSEASQVASIGRGVFAAQLDQLLQRMLKQRTTEEKELRAKLQQELWRSVAQALPAGQLQAGACIRDEIWTIELVQRIHEPRISWREMDLERAQQIDAARAAATRRTIEAEE